MPIIAGQAGAAGIMTSGALRHDRAPSQCAGRLGTRLGSLGCNFGCFEPIDPVRRVDRCRICRCRIISLSYMGSLHCTLRPNLRGSLHCMLQGSLHYSSRGSLQYSFQGSLHYNLQGSSHDSLRDSTGCAGPGLRVSKHTHRQAHRPGSPTGQFTGWSCTAL
jgi:hypothetical protein